jgi:hypothetical protein
LGIVCMQFLMAWQNERQIFWLHMNKRPLHPLTVGHQLQLQVFLLTRAYPSVQQKRKRIHVDVYYFAHSLW